MKEKFKDEVFRKKHAKNTKKALNKPETREKSSKSIKKALNNPISRQKMRESNIRYRKDNNINGWTSVGKNEKKILNKLQKEYGSIQRQKEFFGYVIDGYSKKHNICFEVDESAHFNYRQKKKDIKREKYIGERLKCLFIRIKDNGEIYKTKQY